MMVEKLLCFSRYCVILGGILLVAEANATSEMASTTDMSKIEEYARSSGAWDKKTCLDFLASIHDEKALEKLIVKDKDKEKERDLYFKKREMQMAEYELRLSQKELARCEAMLEEKKAKLFSTSVGYWEEQVAKEQEKCRHYLEVYNRNKQIIQNGWFPYVENLATRKWVWLYVKPDVLEKAFADETSKFAHEISKYRGKAFYDALRETAYESTNTATIIRLFDWARRNDHLKLVEWKERFDDRLICTLPVHLWSYSSIGVELVSWIKDQHVVRDLLSTPRVMKEMAEDVKVALAKRLDEKFITVELVESLPSGKVRQILMERMPKTAKNLMEKSRTGELEELQRKSRELSNKTFELKGFYLGMNESELKKLTACLFPEFEVRVRGGEYVSVKGGNMEEFEPLCLLDENGHVCQFTFPRQMLKRLCPYDAQDYSEWIDSFAKDTDCRFIRRMISDRKSNNTLAAFVSQCIYTHLDNGRKFKTTYFGESKTQYFGDTSEPTSVVCYNWRNPQEGERRIKANDEKILVREWVRIWYSNGPGGREGMLKVVQDND